MKANLEVLLPNQLQVLESLGGLLSKEKLYLAGGIALGLHFGHRRSRDLDWFGPIELDDPLELAATIRTKEPSFRLDQFSKGTLYGSLRRVGMSMLRYRYPLLKPLVQSAELGCKIASVPDLAAMKLAALAQRGYKRDFVDVYVLAQECGGLAPLLAWFERKYQAADVGHAMASLTYFDDAERQRMPPLLRTLSWRVIKKSLEEWVRELR